MVYMKFERNQATRIKMKSKHVQDIKPANLLIDQNDQLKIADFGLSRLYDADDSTKTYSPQVASRWYRAPELLWGSPLYGPAIDMWAVGCIFAEILRGIPLFGVSFYFSCTNKKYFSYLRLREAPTLSNWLWLLRLWVVPMQSSGPN